MASAQRRSSVLPGIATQPPPVILIVDDEEHVRDPVVAVFEEAGFEVLEAGSGMAAIMLLRQRPHLDALFTDIVMPSAPDGFRLAEIIHATSPACAILLTSDAVCPVLQTMNTRMRFVPKPYDGDHVLALVRALMRSVAAAPPVPPASWWRYGSATSPRQ
nr:response regulator [uncultured Lichenicoccus sp.]